MAVETTVMNVTGMEQVLAGLSRLEAWAQGDALKTGLTAAAEVVAEEARRLVPVKTGRLRGAIRIRPGRKGPGSVSMLASVGKRWFVGNEFYGAFQEFGWKSGKRGQDTLGPQIRRRFRELMSQSRAARVLGAGRGLAAKGTPFRKRQEEFFWRQANRDLAGAKRRPRRQIPGEHYMEYAFEEKKQNAMGVIVTYAMSGIENELRKVGKTL